MATAKKLPSGSWRCLVYSHSEWIPQPDGTLKEKKIRKSFTCDDPSPKGKRKCEAEASAWAVEREQRQKLAGLTFERACRLFIASRTPVLSPRTVESYNGYVNTNLSDLLPLQIDRITQRDVQLLLSEYAIGHSPKTVKNLYCFISAVMKEYRPGFHMNVVLPKRYAPDLYIPTDNEVRKILASAEGDMKLAILLAAFGPMRRGEISALRMENIDGNIVHVCENMVIKRVKGSEGEWIIKGPKSVNGDRYIEYPAFVSDLWKGKTDRVVDLNPDQISRRFARLLKNLGMHSFRFHDLRHWSASVQHALGVPDVFLMQRGGWRTDTTLKSVYRHAMSDRQEQMNKLANDYFETLA